MIILWQLCLLWAAEGNDSEALILETVFGQRAVLFSLSGPHVLRIQLRVKKDETSKQCQLEQGPERCRCIALTLQPSPAASKAVQNGGEDFTVTWAGSGTRYIP